MYQRGDRARIARGFLEPEHVGKEVEIIDTMSWPVRTNLGSKQANVREHKALVEVGGHLHWLDNPYGFDKPLDIHPRII